MKIRLSVLLLLLFAGPADLSAQDFSNKGKDFWVGYGYHIRMNQAGSNSNTQDMVLYFTSDQTANITVEIPSVGYTRNYTVQANQVVVSQTLPKTGSQDARLNAEGLFNRGIHITSDNPIVAYAHIYNQAVSGASLLFPTNTLGQEYYSINFTQSSNENNSNSWFYVIATEDNTAVEITPRVATIGGKAANVPFTITLNKGQVYNVMATTSGTSGGDLTGSKIRSVSSGAGGCKRIAVFSGSGKINIGCNNGSADNLIQQAFPKNAWGKKYLTTPTQSQSNNYFRIAVTDPTTVVKRNGTVLTSLNGGFYYQYTSNTPDLIEADKAILVAQYSTTQGCAGNGNPGDPEMIYLSPVEQTINKITLNSTPNYNINAHYINVVIKNGGISSFKLDGVSKASSFMTHPKEAGYSYAAFPVSSGSHTLYSDTGFNAIAYGYGSAESYGYNAGTNVIDLYQYISLRNQYATVNFPATCVEAPFKFSITLPYQPVRIKWDFNSSAAISPNAAVQLDPPAGFTTIPPDSSFVKDGKDLYVYQLPAIYHFNTTGTFPIKVVVNNPTPDGCSGEQDIDYDVVVYPKPVANWSVASNPCLKEPLQFNDATNGNGRPVILWNWEFGDGSGSVIPNPVKTYDTARTYNVRVQAITDIGCITDTIKTFVVHPPPVASFTVDSPRCVNAVITYTDQSTIASGSISKWYWNLGNGSSTTETTNAPITQTYANTGTYNVTLQTESVVGCKSSVTPMQVVVSPNPVVEFQNPVAVCLPVGEAPFFSQSAISDGSETQFQFQWEFGDGGTSTLKDPVHHYSATGNYNVKLSVTSNAGCRKELVKPFSAVYERPTASFTTAAEICLRDSLHLVNNSTATGQTISSWSWNFGDGNVSSLPDPSHLFTLADTFSIRLHVQSDRGCRSDTMTRPVIVNPLPVAAFVHSSPVCETKDILFTSQSMTNAGTLTNWHWNFGDGGVNDRIDELPFAHVFDTAGTYTVQLAVKSSKGCMSDTVPATIIARFQPFANFIKPEVCLDDSYAQFTDSSFIDDNTDSSFSYLWNFGDPNANISNPNSSTLKNPLHKYTALGPYTAWLKITSVYGCTDSIARDFIVNGSFPEADFQVLNNSSLCSNLDVQISNKSTVAPGDITKIEIYWDYVNDPMNKTTDDFPYPDKIYNHRYPDFQQPLTRNFEVRMVAYSGASCLDVVTKTISVNASPETQFLTIPGICFDAAPRQVTQASETGGLPKAFDFFTGSTAVNAGGMFNPQVAAVGTDTLQYVFVSVAGCRDSSTQVITVWPSPAAKFGLNAPLCEKNDIRFTDSSVAGFSNISSWNWNFGDGNSIVNTSAAPVTHRYSAAGAYQAQLQVATDSGCLSPVFQRLLEVHYLPQVAFSMPDICLPDGNGVFTDLSSIADGTATQFGYLWQFDDASDPSPSTLKNGTHRYSQVGPYQVKLIVTSGAGCIDSLTQVMNTVYPQPAAAFAVTPAALCLGDPFQFTDQSNGNGGAVTQWNWNFDDGSANGLTQDPLKIYQDPGNYRVSLVIHNDKGCISDTAEADVVVHPYPKVDAGPDVFVLEDGFTRLQPVITGSQLSYSWSPALFLDSPAVRAPLFTPGQDQLYTITVTGVGGCAAADQVFVKVLKTPVIPNVFSPNGDGINDVWNIRYLESYPGCTVEIFDRFGRRVFSSTGYGQPWNGSLNGRDLPIGVYYYVIQPKNGRKPMTGSVTILK